MQWFSVKTFPYGSVEGADAALTVFLGVLGGRPSFFKLASSAKTVSPAGKREVRAVPLVQFRCCLRRLLRWQRSDAIRSGLLRAENTHSCNIFRPHIVFWALRFPSSDISPNRSAWFVSRRCVAQLRSAGRVDCHLHLKASQQVVVGQVWCAVLQRGGMTQMFLRSCIFFMSTVCEVASCQDTFNDGSG